MKYIVIKKIHAPIELFKGFFLFDFIFIVCYAGIAFFLNEYFVADTFHIPFIIVSVVFAIILTRPSRTNPGKRFYQGLYLWLQKPYQTYYSINDTNKNVLREELLNEIYEENQRTF